MKTLRLELTFDDVAHPYCMEATFTDEDLNTFKEFLEYIEALKATKVISEELFSSVNLEWNEETGTNIKTKEFDVEYLSSFLHHLRPLILFRERTSFSSITSLIRDRFDNPGMDRRIQAYKTEYITSTFSRYGQMTIDNFGALAQRLRVS
jgi:hypothetical protein